MNAIPKFIYDFYTNKIWNNTTPILLFYICQQREFYSSPRLGTLRKYVALLTVITYLQYTGLLKMIFGILTTCHTQYT